MEAIFDEGSLPEEHAAWLPINAERAAHLPLVRERQEALPEPTPERSCGSVFDVLKRGRCRDMGRGSCAGAGAKRERGSAARCGERLEVSRMFARD